MGEVLLDEAEDCVGTPVVLAGGCSSGDAQRALAAEPSVRRLAWAVLALAILVSFWKPGGGILLSDPRARGALAAEYPRLLPSSRCAWTRQVGGGGARTKPGRPRLRPLPERPCEIVWWQPMTGAPVTFLFTDLVDSTGLLQPGG